MTWPPRSSNRPDAAHPPPGAMDPVGHLRDHQEIAVSGEARRRWVTEQQVLAELEALNDESMATAQQYAAAAQDAAMAEVEHKSARARRILRAKAVDGVKSISEAEVHAEADDDVARLFLARLAAAAHADALREKLRSIRTNQDSLRTAAASHRTPFSGPGMQ